MNRSIVTRLVAKDLYFYRWLIAIAVLVGFASIALMGVGPGDSVKTGMNLGVILFMTDVIALGIFIVMFGLFKERQDKSLLFVLSLPVSPMQYGIAKVASALIAFLVPWAVLTAATIALTAASDGAPDGAIPAFAAMMTFFLANFCLLLALVLVTQSERWAIAGILVTNTAVPAFLGVLYRLPDIAAHQQSTTAVWSTTALTIIAVAVAAAALSLGTALYIQSRRRDFV